MVSNRNLLFQWSIFRCYVSGRVNQCMPEAFFSRTFIQNISDMNPSSSSSFKMGGRCPNMFEPHLGCGWWNSCKLQRWVGYTMNFEEMFVPLVSRICLWNSFWALKGRSGPSVRWLLWVPPWYPKSTRCWSSTVGVCRDPQNQNPWLFARFVGLVPGWQLKHPIDPYQFIQQSNFQWKLGNISMTILVSGQNFSIFSR